MAYKTFMIDENGHVKNYLSVLEMAEKWNVKPGTIRVWISRGKLESVKIGVLDFIKADTKKPERKKRKDAKEANK